MILQVFSVFDIKAGAYLNPFYMNTKGMAIRTFSDISSDKDHTFTMHPEDYVLFHIGEWSSLDGKFVSFDAPFPLGSLLELSSKS